MPQKQQIFRTLPFIATLLLLLPWSAEAFVPRHGSTTTKFHRLEASNTDAVTVSSERSTGTSALYEPPTTTAASSEVASDTASTSTKTATPNTNQRKPLIQSLKSLDEFCNLIDNAPPETLIAMKFYGTSCPLCKRISVKYKKMARYYSTAPIVFAEIPNTAHPELFDILGVTTFPYLQIYRNQQCIASHATVSEKVFERIVNDTIQQFLCMREAQWESFLENFAEPIGQASDRYQRMREIRDEEAGAGGAK